MSKDGFSLVPSPNPYNFKILDCNSEGIIAYGTRFYVALINGNFDHPVLQNIFKAHENRIWTVAFCKHKKPNLLATGSEDGTVKIFDIGTMKELNMTELNAVNVVEWQHETDHIVFVGDEKAGLMEWNLQIGKKTSLKSNFKGPPLSLSSNAHNPNLLAVGRKGGTVEVFDVSKRKSIHILKAHIDDITCLSWSIMGDKLLSTSKDYTIRVWSLGTENPVTTLHSSRHHSQSKNETVRNKHWACAVWHPIEPDCVIANNVNEVGLWNLNGTNKKKFSTFSTKPIGGHGRTVFNLVTSHKKNIVFSYSFDRLIAFWDVAAKKIVCLIPTISGFVYHLDTSKMDSGRLAIGASDSGLRIWNISNASNPYNIKTVWHGIKGKVSMLSWHPTKESIIGFGTDEGRVFASDIAYDKLVSFPSQHKGTVYGISWGPCKKISDDQNDLCLYSCGSGKILIHSYKNQQMEALNFEDIITVPADVANSQKAPFRTDIIWKPDFLCVAVGCDDGIIEVYSGVSFNLLTRLQSHKKSIQSLRWHPLCTTLSSESSLHTWLACSSNEPTIQIYDIAEALLPENDAVLTPITSPTRQLCGHEFRVVCISWCTNIEGRLASASYDGTVQIWDALFGQPLVNFSGHMGRVFCVEFCVLDPDVVFSGGDDYTVRRFRISEQNETHPPKGGTGSKPKRRRKKCNKNQSVGKSMEAIENDEEEESKEGNGDECKASNEVSLNSGVTDTETIKPNTVNCDENGKVDEISSDSHETNEENSLLTIPKQSKVYYQKKFPALLKMAGAKLNLGKMQDFVDCVQLVDIACHDNAHLSDEKSASDPKLGVGELVHLGFFGTQAEAIKMLEAETESHLNRADIEQAFYLQAWKGDVSVALRAAAEKEALTDTLVSFAPLGSRQLWLEMCDKYALQLTKTGAYHKAVLYLLACHKVYEAIDLLKDKVGCRYALCLAKARLPSADPVIKELTSKWSSESIRGGDFRTAAKCCLSQNQPLSAATIISTKPCAEATQVSAYICLKYGHLDDAKRYSMLCLKRCLLENEWVTAANMIKEQPSMEGLMLVVAIHESLYTHMELLKSEYEHYGLLDQIFPKNMQRKQVLIWRSYCISQRAYLNHLYHSLLNQDHLSQKTDSLLAIFEVVKDLLKETITLQTANDALYRVALNITGFFLALTTEKDEVKYHRAFDYLKEALNIYLDLGLIHLLNMSYVLLLPFDFIYNYEDSMIHLKQMIMEVEPENIVQQSFNWLESKVKSEGIFKLKAFPSEGVIVQDKNSLFIDLNGVIDKAMEKFSAISIVDTLLTFFSINFAEEVLKKIIENNLHLRCHSGSSIESENKEQISKHDLSRGSPENAEIDSQEVDNIIKELLSLVEEKRHTLKCELEQKTLGSEAENKDCPADESISENPKECDKFDVEATEKIGDSLDSELDVNTESDETLPEANTNDQKRDSSSQAQIADISLNDEKGDSSSQAEISSETSVIDHNNCVHVVDIVLQLMPTLTVCVCKDIYGIKYHLTDELKQVETSLTNYVVSQNFKKAGSKKQISNFAITVLNTDGPKNDDIISNEEKQNVTNVTNNDIKSNDNEIKVDCKLSDFDDKNSANEEKVQFSQLKAKRDEILGYLNIIKEKEKVRNLPNPFVFLSKMESICNLVQERTMCPAIKEKMNNFVQQLTLWSVKFQ